MGYLSCVLFTDLFLISMVLELYGSNIQRSCQGWSVALCQILVRHAMSLNNLLFDLLSYFLCDFLDRIFTAFGNRVCLTFCFSVLRR